MVFDGTDYSPTYTVNVAVTEQPNNAPTAAPTANPTTGTAPLYVDFLANANDTDGDYLTYEWDFDGDGVADSNLENPSAIFNEVGTYIVTLDVFDGTATTTATVTINVNDPDVYVSVSSVDVRWEKTKQNKTTAAVSDTLAKAVRIKADFYFNLPRADDIVAVTFDSDLLFAAYWSDFVQAPDNPLVYTFDAVDLQVKVNYDSGNISITRKNIDLVQFDNADGVDIFITAGDEILGENVLLTEAKNGLRYRRSGTINL